MLNYCYLIQFRNVYGTQYKIPFVTYPRKPDLIWIVPVFVNILHTEPVRWRTCWVHGSERNVFHDFLVPYSLRLCAWKNRQINRRVVPNTKRCIGRLGKTHGLVLLYIFKGFKMMGTIQKPKRGKKASASLVNHFPFVKHRADACFFGYLTQRDSATPRG